MHYKDCHLVSTTEKRSPFKRLLTTRGFLALVVSNGLGFGGEQMRLAAQSWWILGEGGSRTLRSDWLQACVSFR